MERLNSEKPDFVIYTISIWTDPNAAVSAINFDSKQNSEQVVQESNEFDKEEYEELLSYFYIILS